MPWCQRTIEGDIKTIRKDINMLERVKRSELRKRLKMEQLEKKYNIKGKGITTVLEELKQRILAKAAKIKRYEQRQTQYKQNILFKQQQNRFYQELNGTAVNENVIPDADESKKFWSDIWSVGKEKNRSAKWFNNIKNDIGDKQQRQLEIASDMVTSQRRKLPNWKAPGRDGVQGFWLKKLRGLHGRIAEQLNNILKKEEKLPEWLIFGKTILCLKDHSKGNVVDNFGPISCLALLWKLMTGVIAEAMYKHLEGILP